MGSDRQDANPRAEDAMPPVFTKPDPRLIEDPRPGVWSEWQGAVLGQDEIRFYATKCTPPLIHPWDEKALKPASYHLHLGSCCRLMGDDKVLTKSDPVLRIPPFTVAIVSTLERLDIPSFLIARWNLRVQKVYYGLIWTGSLQVDPGYSGHLFCPIFNLSTEPVTLELGDALFTIDFVKTTRNSALLGLDRKTDSLLALGALDKTRLKSGVAVSLEDLGRRVASVEKRVQRFQDTILVVLSLVIAAITVLATVAAFGKLHVDNWWGWGFSIGLSAVGLLAGTWALLRTFCARPDDKQQEQLKK